MINLRLNNVFANNKGNSNLQKKCNITFGCRNASEIDKFEKYNYNKSIEFKGLIPQMDEYINIEELEELEELDKVVTSYSNKIEQLPISLSFLMNSLKGFLNGKVPRKGIVDDKLMQNLQQRIFVGKNGEDFKSNYEPELKLLQIAYSQLQKAKKGDISTVEFDQAIFDAIKEYIATETNRQTTYII